MFARALTLVSLLAVAAPSLDASAQEASALHVSALHVPALHVSEPARIELDVQLLDVDADALSMLDPKPALDAVVHRRHKGHAPAIGVARYRSLGLRLGLVHQRPGVRVVLAPHMHAIEGAPRSLDPSSALVNAEDAPEVSVTSERTEDGRIALTIELISMRSVVRVVVDEGASVMVSGLEAPPSGQPLEAPQLGHDECPQRARLLFVTARSPL